MSEHNGIVWQDPPGYGGKGRKGQSIWVELLWPLQDHPGRWALIRSYDKAAQAYSAQGALKRVRVGDAAVELVRQCEFTARTREDGGGDLYARFVEEPEVTV